jgi:hypothetical protein
LESIFSKRWMMLALPLRVSSCITDIIISENPASAVLCRSGPSSPRTTGCPRSPPPIWNDQDAFAANADGKTTLLLRAASEVTRVGNLDRSKRSGCSSWGGVVVWCGSL